MRLFYMTFYSPDELKYQNLHISPAGNQKSKYIIEKLDEIYEVFHVFTMSETQNKKGLYHKTEVYIGKHGKMNTFFGFGKPNAIFRRIHHIMRVIQIYRMLMKFDDNDTVISYHSLITAKTFVKAKQKRKFKLVLELEEKYQDVVNCKKKDCYWEEKIIASADAYILATQKLENVIPKDRKFVVCNGTYTAETIRNQICSNGKIHCVYAGTLDPTKGGTIAAATAEFLPDNYHMHILGFGTKDQIKGIEDAVRLSNSKGGCTVTYEGLKSGEEYIRFLQKCDVGMCTQIPDAKYADTSFPSKILVYLANNLRVVCGKISAVMSSDVGEYIYYYEAQNPESIAEAIIRIDVKSSYDSRKYLMDLDYKFEKELRNLLDGVNE